MAAQVHAFQPRETRTGPRRETYRTYGTWGDLRPANGNIRRGAILTAAILTAIGLLAGFGFAAFTVAYAAAASGVIGN